MNGLYLYLAMLIFVMAFLGFKLYHKRKKTRRNYEEREENIFYDAAKNIRRD